MKNTLVSTYLYADGHAVQFFEKRDKDAGTIEYVEITEQFTKAQCSFKGRLIFGRYSEGMVNFLKTAYRIEAYAPGLDHGSENTKRMGIAVGGLSVHMKNGDTIRWTTMPDIISAPFTHQPANEEAFDADCAIWCIHRVARIHRVKSKPLELATA